MKRASRYMTGHCANCKAAQDKFWWVPLCKDCRRAISWAFLAGSAIVGGLVKLLTHWGWL